MNTQALAQTKRTRTSATSVRSQNPKFKNQDDSRIRPVVHEVVRSPGQPLDPATRGFMGSRFGYHFSRIGALSPTSGWRSDEPEISRPGDSFERHADQTASAVLRINKRPEAGCNDLSRREFDFSHVRIHSDSTASESARAMNAHAYTVGSHIVFGQGKFEPKEYGWPRFAGA